MMKSIYIELFIVVSHTNQFVAEGQIKNILQQFFLPRFKKEIVSFPFHYMLFLELFPFQLMNAIFIKTKILND